MDKFNELVNLPEHQRTIKDYSYEELRQDKLQLYSEVNSYFQTDSFFETENEDTIKEFLNSLASEQKSAAIEYLSEIASIIDEQVERLKRDEIDDTKQTGTIESLGSEQSRVNRFLITLNYFK